MRRISTYINPNVWLTMKETCDSEGIKMWKFIEEGIRLRISDYEKRKRKATEFVVPFVEEPPHDVTPAK